MFFLGLSFGEFIALLGLLGGLITALYLLDRTRRRKVVSTLRFWAPGLMETARRRRTHVRDPWSLALQLISLVLLLLAIAQLEWGARYHSRDHVLILDTSAWTTELSGGKTLLEKEKIAAREYVRLLPPSDRVLVVRADSLITPATPFTSNRATIAAAIQATETTFRALNLNRAFSFAAQAQQMSRNPGEIAYIGPGKISGDGVNLPPIDDLRVIEIHGTQENCGIRRILAARSNQDDHLWRVSVSVKDYGAHPHSLRVRASFAGKPLSPITIPLSPGDEQIAEFAFTANSAGRFEAELVPDDDLPIDDRADLELPSSARVRISVFTSRPDILRPLFDGDERLEAAFYKPSEYRSNSSSPDVVVFDQFAPLQHPQVPALWIDPPLEQSPLPVISVARESDITGWHWAPVLASGLNERYLALPQAEIFQTFEGDIEVASAPEGPVVVARPAASGRPKSAVIGFDLFEKPLRFETTTPLLVANLLRWLAPKVFGATEAEAAPVGTDLEDSMHSLHNNERIVHPNLANVAGFEWKPPAGIAFGLPRRVLVRGTIALWKWLSVLAVALLAAEWLLFGRHNAPRVRLILKIAGLAAIALALAAPAIRIPNTRVAAAILMDTSSSIGRQELARASSIGAAIARNKRGNWVRVVPFASEVQASPPDGVLKQAPGAAADATNIEAALLQGIVSLPDGYLPRLVLLSDGYENEGSAARAITELGPSHVSIDVIPLKAHPERGLRVLSAKMPNDAFAGERMPIELRVSSREKAQAKLELCADGRPLGGHAVELTQGLNQITVYAHLNSTGVVAVSGRISAAGAAASFAQAIHLRRARLLYISQDLPEADANLLAALRAARFDVTLNDRLPDAPLSRVQLLVLNNMDPDAFTQDEKARIEEYVKNGGGLLFIGGDRQIYRPHKQMDALDRVLPAEIAPPKRADGTAVALIIDKSSSMEGRKIELARLSAIGVVNHLRATDTIGVLMFDNSYMWAVPMHRAGDKARINRSIAGIIPDGGTQIAPALGEAYRKLVAAKAAYKHIVLLTDGISEEGDSFELAQDALAHHVTISTVGLGQDVNRSYLEKVAEISGGNSYFLNRPQGLEQIVLNDVKNFAGTSAVEKPLDPIVEHHAEILDGVGIESAPPLKGYSRFLAKPQAETILSIDPQTKDPLYVEWQYGLGRAAVFTSDAKSRWAQSWVTWPGFDKFWINVSRNLLRQPDGKAEAAFDSANDDLIVRYRLAASAPDPATLPAIFAIGPQGFEKSVNLEKTAPGLYEGHVHVANATGMFRIRPLADSDAFPETGVYRASREINDYGTNGRLLSRISEATGGRYNPTPESVFDPNGRFIYSRLEFWPGLLALAIALAIAELIARKWSGVLRALRGDR